MTSTGEHIKMKLYAEKAIVDTLESLARLDDSLLEMEVLNQKCFKDLITLRKFVADKARDVRLDLKLVRGE